MSIGDDGVAFAYWGIPHPYPAFIFNNSYSNQDNNAKYPILSGLSAPPVASATKKDARQRKEGGRKRLPYNKLPQFDCYDRTHIDALTI